MKRFVSCKVVKKKRKEKSVKTKLWILIITYAKVVLCAFTRRPHFRLFPIGISVEFAIVHTADAVTYLALIAQQWMVLVRHR